MIKPIVQTIYFLIIIFFIIRSIIFTSDKKELEGIANILYGILTALLILILRS